MLLHPLRIRSADRSARESKGARGEIKYQIIAGHFERLPKMLRWPFVSARTKAVKKCLSGIKLQTLSMNSTAGCSHEMQSLNHLY